MNAPSDRISALERAVLHLAQTGDESHAVVADAIALWLRDGGSDLSFDAALSLPWGWRRPHRIEKRNQMLRDLARRHWPELSGRALARKISTTARRYEAGAFARHRQTGRPDGLQGDLFDVLSVEPLPGEEGLRKIFCASSG